MKNRRRYLWLAVLAIGLLSLIAVLLYQPWDRGPIRYENFERIHEGMPRDEVEALLGCRHGDYTTGPVHLKATLLDGHKQYTRAAFSELWPGEQELGTLELWYGDRGLIGVTFEADKSVLRKEFWPGRRLPSDWWLFLEWRLGLEDTCHHSP